MKCLAREFAAPATGVRAGRSANYRAPNLPPEWFMPVLRVVGRDGVEQEINAPSGTSLMEPLRDMDDGVTAICGGMCSCATCQVYIDESWVPRLPAAMSDETDMLKDLSSYRANSRLSCQIPLTDALDGLRVTIAPEE